LIFCVLALMLGAVAAQAQEVGSAGQWQGSAELGYINTSGNTVSSTLNAKVTLDSDLEYWRHAFEASAYNNSDDDVRSAEQYNTFWQSNYKFNAHQSIFARGEYDDDRFSGWEYQATVTAGYSQRINFSDKMTLDLDAGPGYRYSVYDKDYNDDGGNRVWQPELGNDISEAMVRLAADYNWAFSDTASFQQQFSMEAGKDNVINRSITSLTMDLTSVLALKLSYDVKYTDDVLPSVNQYDRKTIISILYKF
jgi:putative salt-induced outer membrane protein YdiY